MTPTYPPGRPAEEVARAFQEELIIRVGATSRSLQKFYGLAHEVVYAEQTAKHGSSSLLTRYFMPGRHFFQKKEKRKF